MSKPIPFRKEYNHKGGVRYIVTVPLPVGEYYEYMGEKVKVVGPSLAGMVEVKCSAGVSYCVPPGELKPI